MPPGIGYSPNVTQTQAPPQGIGVAPPNQRALLEFIQRLLADNQKLRQIATPGDQRLGSTPAPLPYINAPLRPSAFIQGTDMAAFPLQTIVGQQPNPAGGPARYFAGQDVDPANQYQTQTPPGTVAELDRSAPPPDGSAGRPGQTTSSRVYRQPTTPDDQNLRPRASNQYYADHRPDGGPDYSQASAFDQMMGMSMQRPGPKQVAGGPHKDTEMGSGVIDPRKLAAQKAMAGVSSAIASAGRSKKKRSVTPGSTRAKPSSERAEMAGSGDRYEGLFLSMYSQAVQAANRNKKAGQAPFIPLRDYRNNKVFLVLADGTALVFDVTDPLEVNAYREALTSSGYNPDATAQVAEQASKPLLAEIIKGTDPADDQKLFDTLDVTSLTTQG